MTPVQRAIIADGGTVSHLTIGREMLGCAKCVHPGVRSLWEFHQANDSARGAAYPDTVNRSWCDVIEEVNQHNLEALARSLVPLRH